MTPEELQQQRAAVPDDDQLPATATQADLTATRARRALLDRRLSQEREARTTLATLPSTDADEKWLGFLRTAREQLTTEIDQTPKVFRSDHDLGNYHNLSLSLRCIKDGVGNLKDSGRDLITLRLGQLMVAAGYEVVGAVPERGFLGALPWAGSITETEARIDAVAVRRAHAQSMLDDALMDDAEREQQEADTQRLRKALDTLRLRGPKLQVQGVDEADLTPLQREALSWARKVAGVSEPVMS